MGGMMEKKRSVGTIIFGIILIFISIYEIAELVISSNQLGVKISVGALLGWLVPAVFGIGILKLNNIFRVLTICMSSMFIVLTPILYFCFGKLIYNKTSYAIESLSLVAFSLCAIYYFTRPKVKEQFK